MRLPDINRKPPRTRRIGKPILVTVALLGALYLTIQREGPRGLAAGGTAGAQPLDESGLSRDFLAARLPILNRVIMLVHERYIEPTRIDQRAMLLGGLDHIQRSVAEVLVRHDEGSDHVTVQVDTAQEDFSLDDVDRPWALSFRFREIFRFILSNLRSEDVDMRDVEYAAANGLLQTLDPHSVLLVPEVYEEMRLGTRGEFGGLGIVISIRDGQLTIISPIDGTPAARAGLRRMDRIIMIGEETTINMTLDEAVDRLRGPPGTPVSIMVRRRGWTEPHQFEITRAIIRIESVESHLLEGNIGYVRIRNFQGNTYDDLRDHLGQLRGQGMQGLVLDLRDDPGGLLDQAVHVADAFLSAGVIVTTAANDPSEREVRSARSRDVEPRYPMVVLVNSGSASASEIVAGALKGNDRALVMGERTFGKGSVQVLYDFEDGSALKLTIAHYLTPGDISIQSVGIVPDIEVVPLSVQRRHVDLFPEDGQVRESDLDSHLDGSQQGEPERPSQRVTYYRQPRNEPEQEPAGDQQRPEQPEQQPQAEQEDEPDLLQDFEIQLAHQILSSADEGTRTELLEIAANLIGRTQAAEDDRVVEALQELGVDWREGPDEGATLFQVEVELAEQSPQDAPLHAGQTVELTVRVTNRGTAMVHRVHGVTESDNPYFNDRELPLGRLAPGETKEWTLRARLPRDVHTRIDPVRVVFSELHGHAPPAEEVSIAIEGLPRPTFAYAWQVVDHVDGNGDGRVSRGERAGLLVTVTNRGPGQCYRSQVNIKNESGEGVLIHDGRFDLEDLAPGQTRTHTFSVEVLDTFDDEEIEIELIITDFDLREEISERMSFPLASSQSAPQPITGRVVQTVRRLEVYEWPEDDSHLLGWVAQDSRYDVTAELGEHIRIDLGEGRPGWIRRDATEVSQQGSASEFQERMDNTPPEIAFGGEPPLTVGTDSLRLSGEVSDADRVLDMYVFVGSRKVFYLSNREGADQRRLTFDANLPLEEGSNPVLVVARESSEVVARRVLIIRRTGDSNSATHGD